MKEVAEELEGREGRSRAAIAAQTRTAHTGSAMRQEQRTGTQ